MDGAHKIGCDQVFANQFNHFLSLLPATLTFAAVFFGFVSALAGAGFWEEKTSNGEIQPQVIHFSIQDEPLPTQTNRSTPPLVYLQQTAAPIASSATNRREKRRQRAGRHAGIGKPPLARRCPALVTYLLRGLPVRHRHLPTQTAHVRRRRRRAPRRGGKEGGRTRDAAARSPARPSPRPPLPAAAAAAAAAAFGLGAREAKRPGRPRRTFQTTPLPPARIRSPHPVVGSPPGSTELARKNVPAPSSVLDRHTDVPGAAASLWVESQRSRPPSSLQPPVRRWRGAAASSATPRRELRCLPLASPFSSAWRSCAPAALGRDPRCCGGSHPTAACAGCLTASSCLLASLTA